MSDIYYFPECHKCGFETNDWPPELSGYEGDTATCSKCKTVFKIEVSLVEEK